MAVQQEIEIAKALSRQPRYVVFDEPSASLGETETEHVLDRIRALRDQGVGVSYISHRLDEVREVCDEIVCLRDGERVASWDDSRVPKAELVNAMVGREFTFEHVAAQARCATTVVLEVRGLRRDGVFADIDFDVAAGEVLGIAGLVGAGPHRGRACRSPASTAPTPARSVVDGKPAALHQPARGDQGRRRHGPRGPQGPGPQPGPHRRGERHPAVGAAAGHGRRLITTRTIRTGRQRSSASGSTSAATCACR